MITMTELLSRELKENIAALPDDQQRTLRQDFALFIDELNAEEFVPAVEAAQMYANLIGEGHLRRYIATLVAQEAK